MTSNTSERNPLEEEHDEDEYNEEEDEDFNPDAATVEKDVTSSDDSEPEQNVGWRGRSCYAASYGYASTPAASRSQRPASREGELGAADPTLCAELASCIPPARNCTVDRHSIASYRTGSTSSRRTTSTPA